MQPSPQFKTLVSDLLRSRQKAITIDDFNKHENNATAFYALVKMRMQGAAVISQTPQFSDQTIIEISKGAGLLKVTTDGSSLNYKRTSELDIGNYQGSNLLYWQATDSNNKPFTVVKLMSPDGYVLIKLIDAAQNQTVFTVCELPLHMIPK